MGVSYEIILSIHLLFGAFETKGGKNSSVCFIIRLSVRLSAYDYLKSETLEYEYFLVNVNKPVIININ